MINCLVVDDEPIARNGLVEHIKQIDFLVLISECKSAMEATGWLQKKKIDLIFLDIQMPLVTGIDFIKTQPSLPAVIFTTAYSQYAIEGYELDVLDYLLKPISFNRFLKSALKAQEFLNLKNKHEISFYDDFFFLKCNQKIEKIMMADVLYIEGMSNYIVVHTALKKYVAYLTFKGIEQQLPHNVFIRIHKSYLVSINAIQSIDTDQVRLETITLPVSKNFREEVMAKINHKLFKR